MSMAIFVKLFWHYCTIDFLHFKKFQLFGIRAKGGMSDLKSFTLVTMWCKVFLMI
jgi:hypothetical protein